MRGHWWRWNGQASSVINASYHIREHLQVKRRRCPSLKPTRTMKGNVPLGWEPEAGLLSEGKKFIRGELAARDWREKGRGGGCWWSDSKLKLCPLAPHALRFLLLEGIYDVGSTRGAKRLWSSSHTTPPSMPQALFTFWSEKSRAAMTPLCRWKNSKWEDLLPIAGSPTPEVQNRG